MKRITDLFKKTSFALFVGFALLALCACGGTAQSSETTSYALTTEAYDPTFVFDARDYAEDTVEIRRVTEPPGTLEAGATYTVEFDTENMALAVPLSLLQKAEETESFIAMMYTYPEDSDQETIEVFFPMLEEYKLYFPDAQENELYLMIGEVEASNNIATSTRDFLEAANCTVVENQPVKITSVYLVWEQGDTTEAIKLDTIGKSVLLRETGLLTSETDEGRLYSNDSGDVYKATTLVYTDQEEPTQGFIDTLLFGSFTSTQGKLPWYDFADITGHYAENAIKQAQLNYNMAAIITSGATFNPDEAASEEDLLESLGASEAIPMPHEDSSELSKDALVNEYQNDTLYTFFFDSQDDYLVQAYMTRIPSGYVELFNIMGEKGQLEDLENKDLSFTSRINSVLMCMSDYLDVAGDSGNEHLIDIPNEATADQWLLGINDVDTDDPLRPYAALAVHYGLLMPDAQGNLDIYEAITRADLCYLHLSLTEVKSAFYKSGRSFTGFAQELLVTSDSTLPFNVTGAWQLTTATKKDGTTYTQEEMNGIAGSFVFDLGTSTRTWSQEEYSCSYWYSAQGHTVTLCYEDGSHEVLQLSEDLTELTYRPVNAVDSDSNGEVYTFMKVE